MIGFYGTLLVWGGLVGTAHAETLTLSYSDALSRALSGNPTLAAAGLDLDAADGALLGRGFGQPKSFPPGLQPIYRDGATEHHHHEVTVLILANDVAVG